MGYQEDFMLDSYDMQKFRDIISRISKSYVDKIPILSDTPGFFESSIPNELAEDEMKTFTCQGGRSWCVVMPNGVVTPCDIIRFYAGNIRKEKVRRNLGKSSCVQGFQRH